MYGHLFVEDYIMTDDCESQDFYTLQEIGKSFTVISIKYKFYSKKRLYKYKKKIFILNTEI